MRMGSARGTRKEGDWKLGEDFLSLSVFSAVHNYHSLSLIQKFYDQSVLEKTSGACYATSLDPPLEFWVWGLRINTGIWAIAQHPVFTSSFIVRELLTPGNHSYILFTVIIPTNPYIWFLKLKTNNFSMKTNTPVWKPCLLYHSVATEAIKE